MTIMITGGAGYIGSHTTVELVSQGYEIVLVDNFSNSKPAVLDRLRTITGHKIPFFQLDVRDKANLAEIFRKQKIDGVIHFAGHKAVEESAAQPLAYYRNNLESTLAICEVMEAHDVRRLIFSSSATVYGDAKKVPVTEHTDKGQVTNPYGRTKQMGEQILTDVAQTHPDWQITLLRYFNPIGAHHSGLIGEDPNGVPNNLLPYVAQVAVGRREKVSVYGNDYKTPDGTGVRDYIHVVDLARGHVAALNRPASTGQVAIYNLGTGHGYTVLQVVRAFEAASGKTIPFTITSRRPGDIAVSYADCTKAKAELNWQASKNLRDMCTDTWRWQSANPYGYADTSDLPDSEPAVQASVLTQIADSLDSLSTAE